MPRQLSKKPEQPPEILSDVQLMFATPLGVSALRPLLLAVEQPKAIRLRPIKADRPHPASQQELDRLYEGVTKYAATMYGIVHGYGPDTKDMQPAIDNWNAYVNLVKSLPSTISYPATPVIKERYS